MSIPLLLPTLAARFRQIIVGMNFAQPTGTAFDRREMPLLAPLRTVLRQWQARFAALIARAQAGTLRRAPRRMAGKPMARRLTWPRPPRALPGGHMWMSRLAGWTWLGGSSIQQLVLEDAELAALIEAAPQVKRLLRSILWATCLRGSEMPEILRLPPRVRAPRRRPPRPAVPAVAPPGPKRPVSPRWPYRPSCNWPKGVLDKPPRRRRATKLRSTHGPS